MISFSFLWEGVLLMFGLHRTTSGTHHMCCYSPDVWPGRSIRFHSVSSSPSSRTPPLSPHIQRIARVCCAFSGRQGDVMRRGSGGAQGQVGSPVQLGGKSKGERWTLTPIQTPEQSVSGISFVQEAVRNDPLLITVYDFFFFRVRCVCVWGGDSVYRPHQESSRLKVCL